MATLRLGSVGPEVRELKHRLAALGYYPGAVNKMDDKYSFEAAFRVSQFQRKNLLVPDGEAGVRTMATIARLERSRLTGGLLTVEMLNAILPNIVKTKGVFHRSKHKSLRGTSIEDIVRSLNAAMDRYGMDDVRDVCAFMANVLVECDYFATTEEYTGRGGRIPSHWRRYNGGPHYHGRGLIQLTHLANYRKYFRSEKLGIPDPSNVDKVARELRYVTGSAVWYWTKGSPWGNLSRYGKKGDLLMTVIGVNGGFNHVHNRVDAYAAMLEVAGLSQDRSSYTCARKSHLVDTRSGMNVWRRYFHSNCL
jgi:predicted chitinase